MPQAEPWKCKKCQSENLVTNLYCSVCAAPGPAAALAAATAVLVPRIGNVQALLVLKGDGSLRVPYAQFSRIKIEGESRPLNEYTMEEVAALHALTGQLLVTAYNMQTMEVRADDGRPISNSAEKPEAKG